MTTSVVWTDARGMIAAIAAMTAFCINAETYHLQKNDVKPTALASNEVWRTSGGVLCDEITASDDFVCAGCRIQMRPPTDSGDFAGGSFTIGSDGSEGNGSIYLPNGVHIGFPDRGQVTCGGLVLRKGVLNIGDTGGTYGILRGRITVSSPASEPFRILCTLGNRDHTLELDADLCGDAGSAFEYGSVVGRQVCGKFVASGSTNDTMSLTGGCTNFFGTLCVTNLQKDVVFAVGGAPSAYGARVLLDTDSSFAGKIVVNAGTVLECDGSRDVYEVGSLELRPGSAVVLNGSFEKDPDTGLPSSSRCAMLRIGTSFSATGPVSLSMPGCCPVPNGLTNRFAVLEAPSGTGLDPADFTMAGCACEYVPYSFTVVEAQDGRETLYCEFEPYVSLVKSDNGWSRGHSAMLDSAMTNAASWSDGLLPHPGVNYIVGDGFAVRTPGGTNKSKLQFKFEGKRLIICPGATFVSHCGEFRSSDRPLRFYGGSTLGFAAFQPTLFSGGVELLDGSLSVDAYAGSVFDVDVLTGDGSLKAGTYTRSSSVAGFYRFRDSEGFTGKIDLQQTKDPRDEEGYYRTQYLQIDSCSLGGRLDVFDPKALRVSDESALTIPDDVQSQTLADDVNRGLFVDGTARAVLDAGKELRIDWPLTMNGSLWKQGAGTLVLGGRCMFGESCSADPLSGGEADICLQEGTLRVASSAAVDGCRLVVSNGTTLVLSYTSANADMLRDGLRNVKAAEPFVLCGIEDGKLPVSADFSEWEGPLPDVLEFGLLTVDADSGTLEPVRAMLPGRVEISGLAHPCKMSITETASADSVTFRVRMVRAGFSITVR